MYKLGGLSWSAFFYNQPALLFSTGKFRREANSSQYYIICLHRLTVKSGIRTLTKVNRFRHFFDILRYKRFGARVKFSKFFENETLSVIYQCGNAIKRFLHKRKGYFVLLVGYKFNLSFEALRAETQKNSTELQTWSFDSFSWPKMILWT